MVNCNNLCLKTAKCNPCLINNNPLNAGLVRSVESFEKQDTVRRVNNLEKKTNKIEAQVIAKVGYNFNTVSNKFNCKRVSDPAILQKSNEAAVYMNLSARISILFQRVSQMAAVLGVSAEVNKIARNFRFQPGVVRYNLLINMFYLNERLNYIESIL